MLSSGTGAPALSDHVQRFLRAIASNGRQQILMLFAGGAELTVGEVASRLAIGQSTASEHLAQLRDGGLLTSQRTGKAVRYRADAAGIGKAVYELQACLATCCSAEPAADVQFEAAASADPGPKADPP